MTTLANQRRTDIVKGGDVVHSEEETNYFKIATEPNYIKVYVQDIGYLAGLQGNQHEVLYEVLKNMNYGNLIVLNSFVKTKIAETLDVKVNTIDKALTTFVKTGVLIREGRGTYKANPFLFGKGEWKDIEKFRTEISWSTKGKTIKTLVEKKEDNQAKVDK